MTLKKGLCVFSAIAEKKDDRKKFHEQFENCLTLHIHGDWTNFTKMVAQKRYHTSKLSDEQNSLGKYVVRMMGGTEGRLLHHG